MRKIKRSRSGPRETEPTKNSIKNGDSGQAASAENERKNSGKKGLQYQKKEMLLKKALESETYR